MATTTGSASSPSGLPSVEINRSFYSLPEPGVLRRWRGAVPEGFVFAIKASRYITHMKKLREPAEPVALLLRRAEELGTALGPVLFQLPPRWRCDAGRLRGFLDVLPTGHRYAFELRDPSWYAGPVLELLRRAGAAFCVYELAGHASPREVTADFVYVRLHGPDGAYRGNYGRRALAAWAEVVAGWADSGRDVYCYFDNDEGGHAARNAVSMWQMTAGG